MAIQGTENFYALDQKEFQAVDYQVMREAFALHTQMGNLWDEHEYRDALAIKCAKNGLKVFKEACISVSHNGFCKNYFADLLISGAVYELKTAAAITENHEAQAFGYLFLSNTQHGKIINFRPDSLKWRFVSTSLTEDDRHIYRIDTAEWNVDSEVGKDIPVLLGELLDDWGAYLPVHLYKEALCYLLGLSLESEHQRFMPLSSDTVLYLSALSARKNNLQNNLQKYLNSAHFTKLLWINFDGRNIKCSCLHDSA